MQNFFKSLALTLAALMASPALAESDDPLHAPQVRIAQETITAIAEAAEKQPD
ncbi:hypothetical protein [Celeribacter sp.]|uniref:hypothetical protein n=1 Tax=Celeribacter sp. TaxID=1890673 RepID=UPI003A913D88